METSSKKRQLILGIALIGVEFLINYFTESSSIFFGLGLLLILLGLGMAHDKPGLTLLIIGAGLIAHNFILLYAIQSFADANSFVGAALAVLGIGLMLRPLPYLESHEMNRLTEDKKLWGYYWNNSAAVDKGIWLGFALVGLVAGFYLTKYMANGAAGL